MSLAGKVALIAIISFLTGFGAALGYFGKSGNVAEDYAVRVDTLVQERIRLDTVYRRDTVRLWRAVMRYDTSRVTDTVVRGDTVFVARAVADEAVQACLATVSTCEAEKANLRETLRIADSTILNMPPTQDTKKVALIAFVVGVLASLFAMK